MSRRNDTAVETEYVCGIQTRAARMYDDPEPAEFCEELVDVDGDLCPKHDQDDEPDWDNVREDREELERDRELNGYYDSEEDF